MSNIGKHTEKELEILLKTTPTAIIKGFVPEIIALCDKFGESGQSGGSAPYTAGALADAVKKLCLFKTIAPLTGEEDEWGDSLSKKENVKQNKRRSSVFKKDGDAYFLDAIVWQGEEPYDTFTGTIKGIRSRQFIKEFPFTPKTFYIDVVKKYHSREWFEKNNVDFYDNNITENGKEVLYTYEIKNGAQLEEVWEYYKKT